jgi:hypothetical protein
MLSKTQKRTPVSPPQLTNSGVELRVNENRFGSLEMEITDVRLLPNTQIKSGDSLSVEIEYLAPQHIDTPIFSVTISREDGQICFDTNTEVMGVSLLFIQGEGQIKLHLDRLDLNGGKYFIDVGIYEQTWAYAYDYHWHVYPLSPALIPIQPEVSVVVPIYNEVESLPQLIEALFTSLNNVGLSYELICVDDGSTDGSSQLLKQQARVLLRGRTNNLQ